MPQRRPHINEEKIIAASWRLLSDQGIENFTIRNLCKELNVQAPTIYWYFESKQVLYKTLANLVSREIISDLPKQGDWRERLQISATVIRRKLQQFPCSGQLLMKSRPEADFMELLEFLLQMIEPTSLTDKQKFSYTTHLFNYVINFDVEEYEQRMLQISLEESKKEKAHADLTQFKLLQRMHEEGMFKLIGSDELFNSGVLLLLDGIEQRIKKV
ncbi:TetR/AcrR family tetracycline transcriptional repressor [Paenibacillus phyllosphaerae]|uniref:TetR/AcrR family tetracycline transcriptional repressor n=1 Tax=Paenibacillus phyllosphaerae TaxID=274593 RepID=A0A7W5FRU8_9BACL|nr:TetR/AcrR family transcriptional regulator C-terminal domain-containing protein [Paenibacillus phyllosphaerae]MBB3114672.1 TetR/AcrR family tetracycline transcriptional repressor [Paenibacillus phyllosphaerae]